MRDLKIKPGMDTPKAKLKNPAPKDADSLLKQHMDKRQQEKEPDSRDPVRYATDRVEKNMRRGAALAADNSRRMMKRYQAQKRQGKNSAAGSRTAAETPGAMGGVSATEGGLPYTPAGYSNVPPSHTARREVEQLPFSSQTRKGTKSANAAPQERGRQKAVRDARAAYGRNLAEKRTADRHIAVSQFDPGDAAVPPGRMPIVQGVTNAKGVLSPKQTRRPVKSTYKQAVGYIQQRASRTASPAQTAARRAKAAAQRKAQQTMLQTSAKNGGRWAKKMGGAMVQAVQTIGRGIASAASSIVAAGGGAVVLVLLLTVILVAAIVASPFGILFSNESREVGVVPLSAAVAQVNYDFNERLETLQTADDYDSISVDGQAADWVEVLAVFAVKVAGSNDADAADVATMDADRIDRLKTVFWDMTTIAHRIEVIHHPGSSDDDGWTERNLYITITAKTAEEMKTVYHFNRNQIAALDELLEQRDLLRELIEDVYSVSGDTAALIRNLPEGLSPEREAVWYAPPVLLSAR